MIEIDWEDRWYRYFKGLRERREKLRADKKNRPTLGLGQWEAVYENGKDSARDDELEFLDDLLGDDAPDPRQFEGYN